MKRISYQIIIGTILLILGVLLLLRAAGIYDTGQLLVYAPSLIVLFALIALIKSGFRSVSGPLILIVIFGTIQLVLLGHASPDVILPVIIIAVGLGFIFNRIRRPSIRERVTDKVEMMAILGGVESRNSSKAFRGGEMLAIFGGAELDLRDAQVHDPPAEIQVFTLFGGTEIRVPEGWNVRMTVLPVLGGAEDERRRPRVGGDGAAGGSFQGTSGQPDLIITGFVAFGGVTVKD
ncbi:LiaF domain-containing protein [Methanocalculus sp.]|uniref:LiaF transmembrane domain-containing protein n=1 Tax=Methanocalculus sp. TaxID=2004547 RepID=UPI00261ED748|nr:LiaF domain-containing protein [Methanocalculus sp.]MDG6250096.1 LiaF-related protein [Methanocalculus sp.]